MACAPKLLGRFNKVSISQIFKPQNYSNIVILSICLFSELSKLKSVLTLFFLCLIIMCSVTLRSPDIILTCVFSELELTYNHQWLDELTARPWQNTHRYLSSLLSQDPHCPGVSAVMTKTCHDVTDICIWSRDHCHMSPLALSQASFSSLSFPSVSDLKISKLSSSHNLTLWI